MDNQKKITYVSYYIFNDIKYRQFNIEYISKNLDVTIIDLSKSHDKSFNQNDIKCHNRKKLFILDSYKNLKTTLKNISPDYLVSLEPKNVRNKTFKLSKDLGVKTILLDISQNYDSSDFNMFYIKFKFFLSLLFVRFEIKYFLNNIIKKILFFYNVIKEKFQNLDNINENADILFAAGNKTLRKTKNNVQKIISTHNLDFEACKVYMQNNGMKIEKENSIIFLDQMLYNHPDYALVKNFYRPVSKKYFLELKEFFDFLKKRLKANVSIALHPRCDKKNFNFYNDFFGGNCYQHQTLELTAKSRLVLAHASTTSLSFPIIFKKPVAFITTNELDKYYYTFVTDRIVASIIKHPIINISSAANYDKIENFENIDFEGYEKYFDEVIKRRDAEDISLWDLFLKHIK